jgi:hypothetical protein
MTRVLVVGAGFFGRLVAQRLRDVGLAPLVATRHGPDLVLDAEDDASLRAALRRGDVVVDTAGPFASRSTRLARAAIDVGADVVDLSESLAWSEAVVALGERASAFGSRLFPACSAVAAIAGACIVSSGMREPLSADLFIAPASAETASPATVRGMTASIGRPVRTLRDGRLTAVIGYRDQRAFPGARRRGGLVESAASVLLPRSWPSLRRAEFWVDPNAPLGQTALALAARVPPLAALVRGVGPLVGAAGLGRHDGVFAVELRDASRSASYVFSAPRRSYLIAVEPAVIVAEGLARGAEFSPGVVLPHAQLAPDVLFERLRALGISVDAG